MTEVIHKAVRQTTSEVRTLSYIDDTVLVGPADDIADMLQVLPRALEHTGLSLQPQKTQLWAPQSDQITQHPGLKQIQAKMKDPEASSFWVKREEKTPLTHTLWATKPSFRIISEMSPTQWPMTSAKLLCSLINWKGTLQDFRCREPSSPKPCHPGWYAYLGPTRWNKPKRCVTHCKMPC